MQSATPSQSSPFQSTHRLNSDTATQCHFCELYKHEFLPLVKALHRQDASKIARAAAEMAPEDLRSVVAQNIINSFSMIGREQVKSLTNLTLQPEWNWCDIYTNVKIVKEEITSKVRQCLGLEPESTLNNASFLVLTKNTTNQYHIDSAPLITPHCNKETRTAIFLPDYKPNPLRLKDMINHDGMFKDKTFICVFEGLCRWSVHSQQYHLIFPLSSLRVMFLQCLKEQKKISDTTIKRLLV